MKEQLIGILMNELNYNRHEAEITSDDLLRIQDEEIRRALMRWISSREMTSVAAEGYDAVRLTDRMSYPSALLAVQMLKTRPETAKRLLKGFM